MKKGVNLFKLYIVFLFCACMFSSCSATEPGGEKIKDILDMSQVDSVITISSYGRDWANDSAVYKIRNEDIVAQICEYIGQISLEERQLGNWDGYTYGLRLLDRDGGIIAMFGVYADKITLGEYYYPLERNENRIYDFLVEIYS